MLTAPELLERYRQVISKQPRYDSGESVSLLHATEWAKIMIIRCQQAPEVYSMEIEISFPPCVIDPLANERTKLKRVAKKFIETAISYLEYLLRLQKAGFLLGILSAEGIWSASLAVQNEPNEDLFEKIIPPT